MRITPRTSKKIFQKNRNLQDKNSKHCEKRENLRYNLSPTKMLNLLKKNKPYQVYI